MQSIKVETQVVCFSYEILIHYSYVANNVKIEIKILRKTVKRFIFTIFLYV